MDPTDDEDHTAIRASAAAPERVALVRRLVAARAAAQKARRRGDPDAEAVALARIEVARSALSEDGADPDLPARRGA